ncbi:UDP-3-O-(3-hydroxymyristoyl)glucosamine N-acyltransferase [Stenomitos frigidus]|uniref:UDP-3-O-acylglucosamine N-acyltransferase n=1 Tax=Stenomitos frigidus ULC18 TaxID=2107698 RepID=A0A2T1EC90_9CYAN|nr:UDP-3-O-(3-hydroxymyristoyl)glucosamine N-acyltransferase [Stenomitos frigidus]PSB30328.1 UDP-3-O-(3-hydroxymyristoyl)glucosamine N-acyltransferase [Stenomitos frigidus ULC18]
MKFSELVEKLSTVNGQSLNATVGVDVELTAVTAVEVAGTGNLSYIEGAKFASQVKTTAASALILPKDTALQSEASERGIAWIEAPEPRLMFAQAIALFYQPFRPAPSIHPSAVIDPSVQLGQDVSLGAHVVLQAGVVLGDQVCIHPNVVVYPGAQIGDRTILHANCVIHERTQIGADCVVHAGAVIGSEGFGFVPTRDGWYKMEQSGSVVLEDGVEVGCNSTVDRPAVGDTRIGRNTKLDNLVHIGHGCQIGKGCAIAAQVGLAGGVEVGDRAILAGQVGAANNAKIGAGAIATSKTGVHGTVEPGQIVSGYPAVDHKIYLKSSAIYSRLPEMYQTLKRLQRHLERGDRPT